MCEISRNPGGSANWVNLLNNSAERCQLVEEQHALMSERHLARCLPGSIAAFSIKRPIRSHTGGPRSPALGQSAADHPPSRRHLIDTARPPRAPLTRAFRSRTFAAGLSPSRRRKSGVSSARDGKRRNRP
jgi:hypothetical protein